MLYIENGKEGKAMNVTNDESDRSAKADMGANAPECGPGCGCGASGLSTKGKIIVCLVVGLAAAVVLARGFMKYAGTERDGWQQVFATALPFAETEFGSKSTLWGKPLDSLASLNNVAAEKDGVFVFLRTEDEESSKAAIKAIEAAADKIMSRGTTMAAFILDKNASDYAQIGKQVPAPCVLTMVKGGGMTAVGDGITEEKLVQAFVTASSPSGCGPSAPGCGPSSSGCP